MENYLGRLRSWFRALSGREQIMVAAAGALAAAVIGIYAVTLPLLAAIDAKRAQYSAATERRGAIVAQVEAAAGTNAGSGAGMGAGGANLPTGSVQQIISQSATEAGFVLDRADGSGADKVDIVMSKAKPQAFMIWLNDWEQRGLLAERLTITAGTDGTIAVTATLERPRQ
jgi:type II secretory pathway component PulM